nr:putative nuclease [uncultured Mediterranean phage uvMED]
MSNKKYFNTLNNGKGLDHWSPSSSSMPLAKFNLNYGHHDGVERSMFPMQYKPRFGNLVNNTAQRMECETLYWKDKTITLTNRNYDEVFGKELDDINKYDPVDHKDSYAREHMIEYAHKTIDQTRKVVKELCGKNKITSERYVMNKPKQLLHDIIGRIDYETGGKNGLFVELKTKPPSIIKKKGKDEYYFKTQPLGDDAVFDAYWGQVAFYWKCTGKKPFLVLVNDKEYLIYDDTHAALYDDHLEYQYNMMVKRIYNWEQMIIYCKGDLQKLADISEPPDLNHYYHYKYLTDKQRKTIKKLWGLDA